MIAQYFEALAMMDTPSKYISEVNSKFQRLQELYIDRPIAIFKPKEEGSRIEDEERVRLEYILPTNATITHTEDGRITGCKLTRDLDPPFDRKTHTFKKLKRVAKWLASHGSQAPYEKHLMLLRPLFNSLEARSETLSFNATESLGQVGNPTFVLRLSHPPDRSQWPLSLCGWIAEPDSDADKNQGLDPRTPEDGETWALDHIEAVCWPFKYWAAESSHNSTEGLTMQKTHAEVQSLHLEFVRTDHDDMPRENDYVLV